MILKSIKYKNVSDVNLIVGQNATGKTKAIEVIKNIADMVSGNNKIFGSNRVPFRINGKNSDKNSNSFTKNPLSKEPFSDYKLVFNDGNNQFYYYLKHNFKHILKEVFKLNNEEKLNREYGETGQMYYQKENRNLTFKIRDDELAVTKGDSYQQPFFDKLYEWGSNIAHYKFGGQMGRNVPVEGQKERVNSFYINIPEIGIRGRKRFEDKFDEEIIRDMAEIGYEIESIDFQNQYTPFFTVQEKGLKFLDILHDQLSQGMFRALSLIIQLNYSLLSKQPSLILIDDIGEGLDYERSKKLIDLIIKKIEGTKVQLIMTTNDRFVMNKVPLKYWQVIKREKNKSVFYNYENSKQTFDDFALTGLSNFDFFATEFFVKGFDEYVKVNP